MRVPVHIVLVMVRESHFVPSRQRLLLLGRFYFGFVFQF